MIKPSRLNGIAAEEWDRITKERPDLLEMDSQTVAAYCLAVGTMWEADESLASEGMVVDTIKGNKVANPYLGIRNAAANNVKNLAAQLGLTPKSRDEVKIKKAKAGLKDMLQ